MSARWGHDSRPPSLAETTARPVVDSVLDAVRGVAPWLVQR